jgi:hypothetical protein
VVVRLQVPGKIREIGSPATKYETVYWRRKEQDGHDRRESILRRVRGPSRRSMGSLRARCGFKGSAAPAGFPGWLGLVCNAIPQPPITSVSNRLFASSQSSRVCATPWCQAVSQCRGSGWGGPPTPGTVPSIVAHAPVWPGSVPIALRLRESAIWPVGPVRVLTRRRCRTWWLACTGVRWTGGRG